MLPIGCGTGKCRCHLYIGYNFYCGEGVKQDYDTAVECFRVAAEMGQPNAMFMIGECYYKGKGSEKDPDQAAERYNLKLDFSAA